MKGQISGVNIPRDFNYFWEGLSKGWLHPKRQSKHVISSCLSKHLLYPVNSFVLCTDHLSATPVFKPTDTLYKLLGGFLGCRSITNLLTTNCAYCCKYTWVPHNFRGNILKDHKMGIFLHTGKYLKLHRTPQGLLWNIRWSSATCGYFNLKWSKMKTPALSSTNHTSRAQ